MDTMNIEKKVYDAEDIQKLLGIGRSKAYTFLYSDAILYKERSRKSVTFVTYRDALCFLVLRRFEKVNF